MFKQVMKKIGVIFLALTLLILDLTLSGAFPLLTQNGKFSLVEQIGYGVWALGSLAIFIVIAYGFKLLSLKEINWRRLVAIASLKSRHLFLGRLRYFVGCQHTMRLWNIKILLKKIFIHVPTYLQFAVVGFIIPIMEEIVFRGLLAKVLFGKYFKTGLVISSLFFMAGHSAFTPKTIVIYGIVSAGYAVTYYKTKHI
ncbi:MAG: CPBP family intramembrane glutamic endopeptidase [Streptococcus thermophilus]